MSVAIVILAAGASTRMGTPKQLLTFGGQCLLRHAVETALASHCRPVVVVLGSQASRLENEISGLPVQIALNGEWKEGMGSSIRTGINSLCREAGQVDAAVLMLCDQPRITSEVINKLVEACRSSGKRVVASEYDGIRGVPALFERALFAELVALRGAEGARQIIQRHSREVLALAVPEGSLDIDTPEDYQRLSIEAGESKPQDILSAGGK